MSDKHIVYTLDEECNPDRFLAVVEGVEERERVMNKWWKAFERGEKKQPEDYNGISHAPIAEFDEWKEA